MIAGPAARTASGLWERMPEEEAHDLRAGRQLPGGRVSIVAVRLAAGPGMATPLDRVEGDLGAAVGEADLADGGSGPGGRGVPAAIEGGPEADGGGDVGRHVE